MFLDVKSKSNIFPLGLSVEKEPRKSGLPAAFSFRYPSVWTMRFEKWTRPSAMLRRVIIPSPSAG